MTEFIYLQPENRKLLEKIGIRIEQMWNPPVCQADGWYEDLVRIGDGAESFEGDGQQATNLIRGAVCTWLDERCVCVSKDRGSFNVWNDDTECRLAENGTFYHATSEHTAEDFPDRDTANMAAVKALIGGK